MIIGNMINPGGAISGDAGAGTFYDAGSQAAINSGANGKVSSSHVMAILFQKGPLILWLMLNMSLTLREPLVLIH